MTHEEVVGMFKAFDISLRNQEERIRKLTEKMDSEIATLKAQVGVKTRIAGTPMTPFASRLQPVKPAGGNGSQQ